ncbi:hypothetical protein V5F77_29155, partial [Xanthobacter sp. DSM 24535]|uniref:hypothetical protein n=1 Tax=Roseixanthobacter psychrophilus TaxID=3119917 RepID=UPI0037293B4C
GVVQFFGALFSGDWTGMQAGLQTLLSGAQTIGSAVLGILSLAGSIIIDWLDAQLGTNIRGWPAKVGAALSEGASAIGTALQSAFGAVGTLLATIWQTNFDRVQELFERFRAWIDGWTGGA